MNPPALVFVELYQTRGKKVTASSPGFRPQNWRWRAINGDNQKKMATSGEAYTNLSDCLDAVEQLFGASTNVYLRRSEHGDSVLRLAVEQ